MKILVIGGSGVIGFETVKKLKQLGHSVFYTYYQNKIPISNGFSLDITDKNSILEIFEKILPDIVIHTTAITNVDLCEIDQKLATDVNITGTSNIISACIKNKSKLVYISTSFVFDGSKNKYSEEDITNPATFYGHTKDKSEKLVKNSGLPFLILRTDLPYGLKEKWQHTNSVLRVIDTVNSGKILNEITDWYNKPTFVPNFVDIMIELLMKQEVGIFHVVGSDFVNRYDFSITVANIFQLNQNQIKPINSKKLKLPAKRVNVNLEIKKIQEKTNIKIVEIKEGLIKMKKIKQES